MKRTPIKIIHKYKNSNNNVGYKIYIFIGSLVKDEVINILDQIKKLSFTDTLLQISKANYQLLEDTYGSEWYNYFFNSHHIHRSKVLIKKNKDIMQTLTKKYSSDWVSKNLLIISNLSISNAIDKYSDYIKNILKSKNNE
jgi:hypothetical protein